MKEMINEKRRLEERREENKIMNVIHEQAMNNFYLDKGRRYLKAKKEQTKKEHQQKIFEFIVCSVLFVLLAIFMIFALVTAY